MSPQSTSLIAAQLRESGLTTLLYLNLLEIAPGIILQQVRSMDHQEEFKIYYSPNLCKENITHKTKKEILEIEEYEGYVLLNLNNQITNQGEAMGLAKKPLIPKYKKWHECPKVI